MKIELLIKDKVPKPPLGVFNGYIEEGINQVSRIELLAVSEHEYKESELEEMVGAPAALKLSAPVDGSLEVSRFDGVLYELHQMNSFLVEKDQFAYRLVIRPWVWQFHIGADSRSFPNMRRIDVIDAVLKGGKGKYYDTDYFKESDYPALWQILQCDISDWEFVCQLMREAGINFYFGAPKDGGSPEMMHLIDNSNFFPSAYKKSIPWNPASGLVAADRHIHAFETQARAVPKAVESTASFGDGLVRRYTVTEEVQKGKCGTFRSFGVEGQEEAVAKHRAKVLSQGFGAHRLTYRGASNHFLIRAGKRITIGGPYLSSEKKILVTAVHHEFHRTVPAASDDESETAYENTFVGVKADAEIRPIDDLIEIDTGTGRRCALTLIKDDPEKEKGAVALLQETVRQLTATVDQLAKSDRVFGVMLGEVVGDAKVTDGKEMTCRIENERFPDGITAKVSVAWLVPGGGVTCLPRVGMQVYFMIEQGQGGLHEAVVVGYRPSSVVPGRDPTATITTHRLKPGGSADKVVEKDSFAPTNRQRVGIRGEEAVCEVTLLDAEGSVSVNATKDLYFIADATVNLRSDAHLHMADTVGEQYGDVDRYVDRDQTEWIKGNHDMRISGDQSLTVEGNQHITVEKDVSEQINGAESKSVKKSRTVTVEQDYTRQVDGNETVVVNKGRSLTVTKDYQKLVKGSETVTVEKDLTEEVKGTDTRVVKKNASLSSDEVISLEAKKKVQITCGDAVVTIEKNGNVTIQGKKLTYKASGNVIMKGSKITLN